MTNKRNWILCLLIAVGMGFSFSCKKVVDGPKGDGGGDSGLDGKYFGDYTFSNSLYDSLYMYAKAFYFWNNKLPSFEKFNPKKYEDGDELTGLRNELYALSQIAINPDTHQPYEYFLPGDAKYSFMLPTVDNSGGGGNSSMIINPNNQAFTLDGFGNDLGISLAFSSPYAVDENGDYILNEDSLREFNEDTTITILRQVDKGSPADLAGLKRGDIIYKFNGEAKGFDSFTSEQALNAYYNGILDASSLEIVKVDSVYPKSHHRVETVIHLQKKQYEFNPVALDTIISLPGGKKVGYLVFEGFTELDNAKKFLSPVLKKFEGVSDIVVDLRYNGGGAVETADYLLNNLIVSGKDGSTLYSMHYNDSLRDDSKYSSFLKSVLKSQVVKNADGKVKGNALGLDYSVKGNTEVVEKLGAISTENNRLFFIVGGGTASASELVINALKPYNNVVTVGAWYAEKPVKDNNGNPQIRTYGKPIGFFDLTLGDYTVYMSMFQILNSKGQGDYYQGMLTDELGMDDPFTEYARSEEPGESLNLILKALDKNYVVPGASASKQFSSLMLTKRTRIGARNRASIKNFEANQIQRNFKPMVNKRLRLK